MQRDLAHDRRQRRLLVGLALLFFAPLGVSFYLYYGPGWRPGNRVNHGDLIDPPRPLPELSLPLADHAISGARSDDARSGAARSSAPSAARGYARSNPQLFKNKWTLLYIGAGGCSAICRTELYNTRQVRIALNRDMERVQRVFIATGECCDWPLLDAEHPDLVILRETPEAAPLFAVLPSFDGVSPAVADRVYIIDPLGNLMMAYTPAAKPKGMLTDLKRLLGLSHVG